MTDDTTNLRTGPGLPGEPTTEPAPGADAEAPRRVDRYELGQVLGAGGMATVYRAAMRGPGGAARPVALKLIHPHLSREREFVLMFLGEMGIAMALAHRNIVQTFDAGQDGDRYYMVMELINGITCSQMLRRLGGSPAPPDIAAFIAMEVCAALHHAHSFKPELTGQPGAVVHRDISPSNVLLSWEGDVKLADFGVARARDVLLLDKSLSIKGKLVYIAPEQARGRPEVRSDIFSLGVMLYELLTGRVFREALTLDQVVEGPLDTASIELPATVPPRLAELVRACVAADARDRPESAEALRGDLAAEHLRLQVDQETGADAHGRLKAFLAKLPREPQRKDPAAAALAAALMDEVRSMETAAGLGPVELAPQVPTRHGMGPARAPAPPREAAPPEPGPPTEELQPRKPSSLLPAAMVAILALVAGLSWWAFSRQERGPTPPPVQAVATDTGASPDQPLVMQAPDAAPDMAAPDGGTDVAHVGQGKGEGKGKGRGKGKEGKGWGKGKGKEGKLSLNAVPVVQGLPRRSLPGRHPPGGQGAARGQAPRDPDQPGAQAVHHGHRPRARWPDHPQGGAPALSG